MIDLNDKLDFIRDRVVSDAKKTHTPPSLREKLEDIASLAHEEGDVNDPWPQVLDAILTEMPIVSKEAAENIQSRLKDTIYAPVHLDLIRGVIKLYAQHIREGGK